MIILEFIKYNLTTLQCNSNVKNYVFFSEKIKLFLTTQYIFLNLESKLLNTIEVILLQIYVELYLLVTGINVSTCLLGSLKK